MIGANAAAAELAVQMLDKFNLQGWNFSGATDSTTTTGAMVRVIVTPPKLPAGCGYSVLVRVDDDANFSEQLGVAVKDLTQMLTTAAPYESGNTPDSALDDFFKQLKLPDQVVKEQKAKVQEARHPEEKKADDEEQKPEEEKPEEGEEQPPDEGEPHDEGRAFQVKSRRRHG